MAVPSLHSHLADTSQKLYKSVPSLQSHLADAHLSEAVSACNCDKNIHNCMLCFQARHELGTCRTSLVFLKSV